MAVTSLKKGMRRGLPHNKRGAVALQTRKARPRILWHPMFYLCRHMLSIWPRAELKACHGPRYRSISVDSSSKMSSAEGA